MDPETDDGNTGSGITHWAPASDNSIVVYPAIFNDTTLKVDGKAQPTPYSSLSEYLTIPYRRQDSFLHYLLALALDRENDDRAPRVKREAMELIRQDIQDDMSKLGSTTEPRLRHYNEQRFDGISSNLEDLYAQWAWNS
jgi:hypothetical protein